MPYTAEGLKQVAILNKDNLRNKFFNIRVEDEDYKFKISGVGSRSLKIEKFFYYSDIMKNKSIEDSFEYEIFDIIEIMSDDSINSVYGLRDVALANKHDLKSEFVNVYVGDDDYDFRISGIGTKAIKLELYMSYEEISEEINDNNTSGLEFIFLKLIMGDAFDYDKFKDEIEDSEPVEDVSPSKIDEEEFVEINVDSIEKLSEDDVDELVSQIKGWQKLVFDSIDDIIDDTFTLDDLLNQKRILSYKTSNDDLEEKVLDNLNQLNDLGLVVKVNKETYVKLWE